MISAVYIRMEVSANEAQSSPRAFVDGPFDVPTYGQARETPPTCVCSHGASSASPGPRDHVASPMYDTTCYIVISGSNIRRT